MICSIHQPNYIPYLGLFNKISQSDVFVFYDTAQYTKEDYQHRNTIKGSSGPILLSLPVSVHLGMKIKEVNFDSRILAKHWKTLEMNYKKAPYFEMYRDFFMKIYSYDGNNLAEFNIQTIRSICGLLKMKTELVTLSEVCPSLESKSTSALLDICNLVGANTYISGVGGRGYVDESAFDKAGIVLNFQDFKHPVYRQLWGDFVPYMSIVDLIFNEGENSPSYIA